MWLGIKELSMRYFGTIKSFDETLGCGSIQPERGHDEIGFEKGAVIWRRSVDPTPGQRLSYKVEISAGRKRALNLRTIFPEIPSHGGFPCEQFI